MRGLVLFAFLIHDILQTPSVTKRKHTQLVRVSRCIWAERVDVWMDVHVTRIVFRENATLVVFSHKGDYFLALVKIHAMAHETRGDHRIVLFCFFVADGTNGLRANGVAMVYNEATFTYRARRDWDWGFVLELQKGIENASRHIKQCHLAALAVHTVKDDRPFAITSGNKHTGWGALLLGHSGRRA